MFKPIQKKGPAFKNGKLKNENFGGSGKYRKVSICDWSAA